MLGKIEGKRRRGQKGMRLLDSITNSMDMNLSKLQEIVSGGQGSLACCSPWSRKELDMTSQLNNKNNNNSVIFLHRVENNYLGKG